jgi:predicted glycogen debranching enzyme
MTTASHDQAPAPLTVAASQHGLDDLLATEWLLPNRIGAYAAGTACGCNTRRYHGLLVAATNPPVGRFVALSTVMEQLVIDGQVHELALNEFHGALAPRGIDYLAEFRNAAAPTFVYRVGDVTLSKSLAIAETTNTVCVRYELSGGPATLRLAPFTSMRDFHHLRDAGQPHQLTYQREGSMLVVRDRHVEGPPLRIWCEPGQFEPDPDWWRRFRYRIDLARGQDGFEDLYTPGWFTCTLAGAGRCELTASLHEPTELDFDGTVARRRGALSRLARSVGESADETTRRLAEATDAFVVTRSFHDDQPVARTILAGYPWFADWGRDAFIALPGLLLCTGRHDEAREVFRVFAEHIRGGLVPNRFDDYGGPPHYNSIDASLWFVVAAWRYLQASGDRDFWRSTLLPACHAVLSGYRDGTQFDIHADADGLLAGGSRETQLTWMDAKLGDEAVTPRHGKPVEVNALWHCGHRALAEGARGIDDALAEHYAHQAGRIADAFAGAFWNESMGCLFDCITYGQADASMRPNQILAVSLPFSPLPPEQQRSVVQAVTEHLLTPLGLRTLSPFDPRYRGRYGGSWESRDRAYHQGTAWAWLIGPYVEASLKVADDLPRAADEADRHLAAFDDHLRQAGLGTVSEVFDGDAPHAPRGCFAQAWSVAEVLRAKLLVRQARQGHRP